MNTISKLANSDQAITPDPCHAGGETNFRRAGIIPMPHPNYMLPHVTGAVYGDLGLVIVAKNCIFCGKDCSEDFGDI